jgi:ApaG protein
MFNFEHIFSGRKKTQDYAAMSSTLTTKGIRISVQPTYRSEESNPGNGLYVFAYRVRIENRSTETVQLLSRYWRIADSLGRIREVEGDGVIGKQPVLEPGQVHEYDSWAPLPTDIGYMTGHYLMQRLSDGSTFRARIPVFPLIPDFRMN